MKKIILSTIVEVKMFSKIAGFILGVSLSVLPTQVGKAQTVHRAPNQNTQGKLVAPSNLHQRTLSDKKIIKANQLIIIDSQGKKRAMITLAGSNEDVVGIGFWDKNETLRMTIKVTSTEAPPEITVFDKTGAKVESPNPNIFFNSPGFNAFGAILANLQELTERVEKLEEKDD